MKIKGNLDHQNLILITDERFLDESIFDEWNQQIACVIADGSMCFFDIESKISPREIIAISDGEERFGPESSLIRRFQKEGVRIRLGQTYGETLISYCSKRGFMDLIRRAWLLPIEKQIDAWELGKDFLNDEIAAGNTEKVVQRLIYYHALFGGDSAVKIEDFLRIKFDIDVGGGLKVYH